MTNTPEPTLIEIMRQQFDYLPNSTHKEYIQHLEWMVITAIDVNKTNTLTKATTITELQAEVERLRTVIVQARVALVKRSFIADDTAALTLIIEDLKDYGT